MTTFHCRVVPGDNLTVKRVTHIANTGPGIAVTVRSALNDVEIPILLSTADGAALLEALAKALKPTWTLFRVRGNQVTVTPGFPTVEAADQVGTKWFKDARRAPAHTDPIHWWTAPGEPEVVNDPAFEEKKKNA